MTRFRDSLWDNSEPDYAPGINWRQNGTCCWRAPRRYVLAGYSLKAVELTRGSPDDEHRLERAAKCRALTREMVKKWEGEEKPKPRTVGWLIARYLHDKFSAFHRVKGNTAANYRADCYYWQNVVGNMALADIDFEVLAGIEEDMKAAGRSLHFIHAKFTMLRLIFQHGRLIEDPDASRIRDTLGLMRFQNAPRRQAKATREHVYAISKAAMERGLAGFSVGIRLQFELILRAVDIRGQWIRTDEREGGIIHNGHRWQDGLTWDMFGPDWRFFDKVISKTVKSMPEPIRFDLTNLPDLRADLLALAPPEKRVGPVILAPNGRPYTTRKWAEQWRALRGPAGVPKAIWGMDIRAGAVSEADGLGVPREMLSLAAQHQDLKTTARYVRNRSEDAARVINIRQRKD